MKYSFALMEESGEVKIYYAPSEHKAKSLRRRKIKSSKSRIIAVSNLMRAGTTPRLPMMLNARIAFVKNR